jgi:hypothetical protein
VVPSAAAPAFIVQLIIVDVIPAGTPFTVLLVKSISRVSSPHFRYNFSAHASEAMKAPMKATTPVVRRSEEVFKLCP